MQVIYHTFKGVYPFNHLNTSKTVYVEHLLTVTQPQQCQRLRQRGRIYRAIDCPHLIRLRKVLRDDHEMHFLYEYHEQSIETFIESASLEQIKRINQEVASALQSLENAKIKAEIQLENIGVDEKGNVKLFVAPDHQQITFQEDLEEFYLTEKTRIKIQLQEIWELHQSNIQAHTKPQKNPGFIINGNQLIFTKQDGKNNQQVPTQFTASAPVSEDINFKKQFTKNIANQIKKQKQLAQKFKHNRIKAKNEGEGDHSPEAKGQSTPKRQSIASSSEPQSAKASLTKSKSDNEDQIALKTEHRKSTGSSIPPGLPILDKKMISSVSSDRRGSFKAQRPTSKFSYGVREQNEISEEELSQITKNHVQDQDGEERQTKVQITSTETVSRYRMKIVTCQEIEFEGKEGQDIEKLAQQKLQQYRTQHGYPQILMEPQCEQVPALQNQKMATQEREKPYNGEILAKILRAKEKASTALKQLAKTKKK